MTQDTFWQSLQLPLLPLALDGRLDTIDRTRPITVRCSNYLGVYKTLYVYVRRKKIYTDVIIYRPIKVGTRIIIDPIILMTHEFGKSLTFLKLYQIINGKSLPTFSK